MAERVSCVLFMHINLTTDKAAKLLHYVIANLDLKWFSFF